MTVKIVMSPPPLIAAVKRHRQLPPQTPRPLSNATVKRRRQNAIVKRRRQSPYSKAATAAIPTIDGHNTVQIPCRQLLSGILAAKETTLNNRHR